VTFLANLAADPKALTARMRIGAPEPAELRKAVAKLDQQGEGRVRPAEEVTELQRRIFGLAAGGDLHRLTRRDMREGCKVVLHPPTPLAAVPQVIDGLLHQVERNKRRAAFFAVIDAYLDGFDSVDANVLSLSEKLRTIASRWDWRPNDHWPARLDQFSLLDPARAPELIARRVLSSGKRPRDVLAEAGLDAGGRRFGGLVEAAFRFACHLIMGSQGQEAVDGQRLLIDWARDDTGKFGYQKSWPDFVKASLVPWEVVEPSDAHKSALLEMLERFGGGDPRAQPQRWRPIMDNAPGAYAVLMRWLTRASVLQFLDVVDRLMPDYQAKEMWAYRRAFWTSYLLSDGNSPGIDAAWVAFGDEGARLANRAARESGDKSFSAFGKQNDKSAVHAALILQMGDLTIVDWSHNAKYQVWKRGEKGAPELFKPMYRYGALYNAPIDGSHAWPATYSWQRRLAQIIEGRPFYSPKPTWKPRRA
jgi:hypothetical protein